MKTFLKLPLRREIRELFLENWASPYSFTKKMIVLVTLIFFKKNPNVITKEMNKENN